MFGYIISKFAANYHRGATTTSTSQSNCQIMKIMQSANRSLWRKKNTSSIKYSTSRLTVCGLNEILQQQHTNVPMYVHTYIYKQNLNSQLAVLYVTLPC